MRISVVACELPHPEGTAAGRDLWAWCEGVRALGHELDAWVWYRSASSPEGPVPDWCRYEPYDAGSRLGSHLRAVIRPRDDAARAGWEPRPGAVAVADHLWSAAAVVPFDRSVATFHFRSWAEARAVGHFEPATVQMARAERRAGRRADLVLAYSERVGRHLRRPAHVVPIAYRAPAEPLPPVEAPVAALLADWSWPPNRVALGWLLEAWPTVRHLVPAATLLLGGRHLGTAGVGRVDGVELVGEVGSSSELLGRAAVVAFPCPPSSGPKIKVLEALSCGRPVVTTPAGVEGLVGTEAGTVVVDRRGLAESLAKTLVDPEGACRLGLMGRAAVLTHHSGLAAARARLELFTAHFGPDRSPG